MDTDRQRFETKEIRASEEWDERESLARRIAGSERTVEVTFE